MTATGDFVYTKEEQKSTFPAALVSVYNKFYLIDFSLMCVLIIVKQLLTVCFIQSLGFIDLCGKTIIANSTQLQLFLNGQHSALSL